MDGEEFVRQLIFEVINYCAKENETSSGDSAEVETNYQCGECGETYKEHACK